MTHAEVCNNILNNLPKKAIAYYIAENTYRITYTEDRAMTGSQQQQLKSDIIEFVKANGGEILRTTLYIEARFN